MESNEIKKIIPFDDIWDNLNVLEERLLEISSSSNDYLTSISQYLINAGGKRFRPIVTSLAGKFGNEIENIGKVIDAGVCVELIHIGSLYHDDVMDNATTRRGVESSNSKWNSTLSILSGDYLRKELSMQLLFQVTLMKKLKEKKMEKILLMNF